jgi:hypothetical protein
MGGARYLMLLLLPFLGLPILAPTLTCIGWRDEEPGNHIGVEGYHNSPLRSASLIASSISSIDTGPTLFGRRLTQSSTVTALPLPRSGRDLAGGRLVIAHSDRGQTIRLLSFD